MTPDAPPSTEPIALDPPVAQPAPAVARCAAHPERPSVAICARCGTFLCEACRGRFAVCRNCAQRAVASEKRSNGFETLTQVLIIIDMVCALGVLGLGMVTNGAKPPSTPGEMLLVALGGISSCSGALLMLMVPIALLTWQHRMLRRTEALGIDPGVTRGWAVAWWLIPFVNFQKPFERLQEAAKRIGGREVIATPLLLAWQTSFAGSFLLSFGAPLMTKGESSRWILFGATGCWLIAGYCCLKAVRATQRALDQTEAERLAPTT